jgi:DNA primase
MPFMAKQTSRPALDLNEIRHDHPLIDVVGAIVKLKRSGSELKGCCPFHNEKSPSFTIFSGGQRFHCFGCGAGGDVLDFVRRSHGVGLREAAGMLTGGNVPSVYVAPLPTPKDDGARIAEAREIWRAAQPIAGTPAETYLRGRGLHLPLPASLRFTSLPYGKSGATHPVLLAAVASVDNKLVGIQRTYLAGGGLGKAAVPKPKLSLGRVSGGAIRLAPCARSIVVCEGLEDGLTLQQELGHAVWVAAGASMLPNMQFPPGAESVVVGGDNDDAGRLAARKAANAFASRGLSARTIFPLDGFKDFNEEIQKGARA